MTANVLSAIERNRQRLWALCYRMTGNVADADELAQEASARAIERASQLGSEDATGWLLRLTTRLCLDHARRAKVRRTCELVDPIACEIPSAQPSAENELVLHEDVRFAVVVALQTLSPKQRAALVLRDVCDRSLDEIAATLETNENAVKALLQRARVALKEARHHVDVDVSADAAVIERLAAAIRAGSVETIASLLAEDVWGVTDDGPLLKPVRKPTFGARAVARQWENAKNKLAGASVSADVARVNGDVAVVVRVAGAIVALVNAETRNGLVAALRVLRDPERIARFR